MKYGNLWEPQKYDSFDTARLSYILNNAIEFDDQEIIRKLFFIAIKEQARFRAVNKTASFRDDTPREIIQLIRVELNDVIKKARKHYRGALPKPAPNPAQRKEKLAMLRTALANALTNNDKEQLEVIAGEANLQGEMMRVNRTLPVPPSQFDIKYKDDQASFYNIEIEAWEAIVELNNKETK